MARVGASNDHRSAGESSHTRTTASFVTVTSAEPPTPSGCQTADITGDRDVTCVVGPSVKYLGFRGFLSCPVRCDESGSRQIWTVWDVRTAR